MRSVAEALEEVMGEAVEVDAGFGPPSVDVAPEHWRSALTVLRDRAGCTYFDFLTAVDELADGFRVVCHVASPQDRRVEHVVVRTLVPRDAPTLHSLVPVFAGAAWHERETHEMFGIDFTDGPEPTGLLLPQGFEGHPLRKEFVLASRVAKAWPGAKEPGESDHDVASPSRRRTLPPGVPDPDSWGPRPPGSPAPDPLAHAQPEPAARPRRGRRAERSGGDDDG